MLSIRARVRARLFTIIYQLSVLAALIIYSIGSPPINILFIHIDVIGLARSSIRANASLARSVV